MKRLPVHKLMHILYVFRHSIWVVFMIHGVNPRKNTTHKAFGVVVFHVQDVCVVRASSVLEYATTRTVVHTLRRATQPPQYNQPSNRSPHTQRLAVELLIVRRGVPMRADRRFVHNSQHITSKRCGSRNALNVINA